MNSKTSKVLAVFLTLCLLLSLAAPAFAAGNQITIGTKEELLTFAQNCTLDSWSQGKTVVLTGDIDLTGTDFTPIPTFGGHFDGQGTPSPALRSTAAAATEACSGTCKNPPWSKT